MNTLKKKKMNYLYILCTNWTNFVMWFKIYHWWLIRNMMSKTKLWERERERDNGYSGGKKRERDYDYSKGKWKKNKTVKKIKMLFVLLFTEHYNRSLCQME